MDEKDMQQASQNEGNDSFLDGWEETNSGQEEAVSGGDSGKEAGGQEEGQPGNGEGGQGGGPESPQPGSGNDGGQSAGVDGGQPEGAGSKGEKPESQTEGGQQPPPLAPKTWTLNHMGQTVTIFESDVPVLAEKALDYDRVRPAYDEAQPVMELFRGFAQQAGISVQEYVARLRIQAKQLEGLDEKTARQTVEMEDREARVSIQEARERQRQAREQQFQEAQRRRQERVQADVQEFISVFPNAAQNFNSIPREVWDAVNGGMSLVAAYAQYNSVQAKANAQAAEEQRRREAVQQQNAQNAAASAGSMQSSGSSHGPKDPFLEGWNE